MKRHRPVLLLFVFLALAVRIHRLDVQSLWSDEGLTMYRAAQGPIEIMRNTIVVDGVVTRDTNPPLYFLLLHGWRSLVDDSVWAMRLLGVMAGVLSVPLLFAVGATGLGRKAGLAGAVVLAVSPLHVWHCQEMRNYSLLLLINLLSAYGLFRFVLQKNRARWLVLWAAAGVAGAYTHYFGFFVLAFGAVCLIWLYRRRRWLWWALIGSALAALPILLSAAGRFLAGRQVDYVPVPWHHVLAHAASVYSAGFVPLVIQPWWRVLPALVLAATGLVLAWRRNRTVAGLLLSWQAIPIGLLIVLSAFNPLYNGPRHLLMGLPPFVILISAAPAWTSARFRWISLVLWASVMLSQVHGLAVQTYSTDLIKDDIKSAAHYLNQVALAEDVVVLHDSLIGFAFEHYYNGDAPWLAIPQYGESDPEAATHQLDELGRQITGRVWFLVMPEPRTGFPRQLLVEWAREHWPCLHIRQFDWLWHNIRLEAFLPQPAVESLPEGAVPLSIQWEGNLLLEGHDIVTSARPGEPWWLVLYWTCLQPDVGELLISLRLADSEGNPWMEIEPPFWTLYPPSGWAPGVLMRHDQEVMLPEGLPPGQYQVSLRLLRALDRQPLRTAEGQDYIVLLPELDIQSGVGVTPKRDALLGSAVGLLTYQWPQAEYRPGHPLPLETTWRVHRRPTSDLRLQLQLMDSLGQVVAERISSPTRADYPSSSWRAGEVLLGKTSVLIPAQTAAGQYTVRIALLEPQTGRETPIRLGDWPWGRTSLTLGQIKVTEWPFLSQLPPVQHPLHATLGEQPLAEVEGYDLVASAQELSLILYWRVSSTTTTHYRVLVHLTDQAGQIVSQGDDTPAKGDRPTPTWRPGEIIIDTHTVPLPADLPPGEYRLLTGLYSAQGRLPAFQEGVRQPDDQIQVWVLRLEP